MPEANPDTELAMDAATATRTYYCKQPGCTNEARSPVGMHSYCTEHQGQPRTPTKRANTETMAGKLSTLQAQAKRADRLRAKAEKLTRQALAAKTAADVAQAEFSRALADLST